MLNIGVFGHRICRMICVFCKYGLLLTDFKVGGFKRGTGEESGKNHIDGDGETVTNITFSDLNVLYFCGVSGVSLRTTLTHTRTMFCLSGKQFNRLVPRA